MVKNLDNVKMEEDYMSLQMVKSEIVSLIGQEVVVREYNKTSKKLINHFEGIVLETYDNIFLLEVRKGKLKHKRSFLYNDITIGLFTINKATD